MLRNSSPFRQHLLALALYLAATIVFTWPLALNLTTAIPGDSFDGWQNYWNQWWIKQALIDRIANPLVTDLLYFPTGVNLYFHTLNPFNGVTTLPIQLAFGLIAAYNAVVFLSWVLAGYGIFLLARWVIEGRGARGEGRYAPVAAVSIPQAAVDVETGWGAKGTFASFVAPFVAGLVYTLSPFHMAHLLGHMQVMSLQWMPFYILALLRSLQLAKAGRPWRRVALWAGFFLILTGLCDWYFVLYLFLFTALTLLWHWAAPPGRFGWRKLGRMLAPPLVAGLLFAVALSFWLAPMVLEATLFRFMVRPAADLYILSASVMDFLVPNRLHTLFRPDSFTWIGNQIAPVSERTITIGYTALALAAAALALAWRKAAFWWVMAIFFFVLALGPQWHWGDIAWKDIPAALNGEEMTSWTPYGLLNQLVPFMRISRSVSRFAVMVQLCVAVLAGIGLWRLLAAMQNSISHYVVSVLMLAALIFEYWVAPYPLSPPDTPAWYAELAADPDPRAVLNLPMNYDRPGYLLYQTVHGKPLTVAYISRDDPRTLTERTPVLQHFRHLGPDIIEVEPVQVAGTVFTDLGVGAVVLDRYKMPGGDERTYTEELAAAIFAGQTPVFEDERITVYKVAPVDAPRPYLMLGALGWGPLESTDGTPAHRTLLGHRAEVIVQHPPTAGAVTIRYASDAPVTVSVVLAGDNTVLATSDGASGEVRVDLAEARRVARVLGLAESPLSLRIEAEGEATVRVTEIALEE
jgi:hypothetical protein